MVVEVMKSIWILDKSGLIIFVGLRKKKGIRADSGVWGLRRM